MQTASKFWHNYVQLAGVPTEIYGLDALNRTSPALRIVVYPGNPGNAAFYLPYMEALHRGLAGEAEVVGVSNLGQCRDGLASGQVFSLRQQADHKLLYLQEHVLQAGGPPVVLIGHSIGAYIALQNMQQLQVEDGKLQQIRKVVSLFPFLEFDTTSWGQWALSHLAAWPRLIGGASAGLSLLPTPLQRAFVRCCAGGGLDEHALSTTVGMLSYSHVANALHLAAHEFADLRAPTDFPFLESLGERVVIVCAPRDKWFPQSQWLQLQRRLPGVQAVMERQQRHGFCVSADLSRQLAATTVRLIGSANAADLEAGAGRWQQGGSVAGHRCRVRRGGGRPA